MAISRFKHVSWHAQKKKWVAQVSAGKKRKALYEYFGSETAAADAVKHVLGLTRLSQQLALAEFLIPSTSLATQVPLGVGVVLELG